MEIKPEQTDAANRTIQLNREAARNKKLKIFALMTGLIASITWSLWIFNFDATFKWQFLLYISTTMACATGLIIYYLQPAESRQRNTVTHNYVNQQLAILNRKMEGIRQGVIPDSAREEAVSRLKDDLRQGAAEQIFQEMQDAFRTEAPLREATAKAEQMEARLKGEILDLARRGNVNLALGMLTTMIGLLVLGYAVMGSPPTTTTEDLVLHFLPRLSFAIFVEVFAYFFLRLYKQGLGEIKYFQNELTNIESHAIAIQLALHSNQAELLADMSRRLAATERNFVLKDGQTTVELERERIIQKDHEKLLGILDHLIKAKSTK